MTGRQLLALLQQLSEEELNADVAYDYDGTDIAVVGISVQREIDGTLTLDVSSGAHGTSTDQQCAAWVDGMRNKPR